MALTAGQADTREPGGVPPEVAAGLAPRRRRRWFGTWRRRLAAGVVVAAALGLLIGEGLANATVYFKTANQAVADKASLGTRPFRIEGTVLNDIVERAGVVRFSIYANGVTVPIVDSSQPPELFKVGIPVVLEGHWQGSVYAADQIMVKHTASYVAAHPNRVKPQVPTSGSSSGAGG